MEISTSHKLIFIHIQRTGGASITTGLRPLWTGKKNANKLANTGTKLGLIRNPERVRFSAHDTLAFIQRRLPKEIFDSYLKFAFVRNPYSWLTSMYCTYKRGPNHRHHPKVAAMSGFPEYIDWEIARKKRYQDIFLLDKHGKININFVGRIEQIAEDYQRLCQRIDYQGAELPHTNRHRFTDYREFYDAETREKVAHFWKRDLDLLGYDFEGNRLPCPLDAII